jgi:hypothetical protein
MNDLIVIIIIIIITIKKELRKPKQQLEAQQLTRENTNDYIIKNPLY